MRERRQVRRRDIMSFRWISSKTSEKIGNKGDDGHLKRLSNVAVCIGGQSGRADLLSSRFDLPPLWDKEKRHAQLGMCSIWDWHRLVKHLPGHPESPATIGEVTVASRIDILPEMKTHGLKRKCGPGHLKLCDATVSIRLL